MSRTAAHSNLTERGFVSARRYVTLHKLERAVKIFVMRTKRNDIYFTSAHIPGRAIEYDVPSRLIDAFPRRWLGTLSILLALASVLAVF